VRTLRRSCTADSALADHAEPEIRTDETFRFSTWPQEAARKVTPGHSGLFLCPWCPSFGTYLAIRVERIVTSQLERSYNIATIAANLSQVPHCLQLTPFRAGCLKFAAIAAIPFITTCTKTLPVQHEHMAHLVLHSDAADSQTAAQYRMPCGMK